MFKTFQGQKTAALILSAFVFLVGASMLGWWLGINEGSQKVQNSAKSLPSPNSLASPTPTYQLSPSPKPEITVPPASSGTCRRIPILMYHHVGIPSDSSGRWLYVYPETFAGQMDYLSQKSYNTITLTDVIENLQSGRALPPKPIVLTFDDGYRDIYQNAFPILKAHSYKATLFIITQLAGGGNYLAWEELAEMTSSGLITIGDHTLSHPSLPILSPDRLKNEIVSAKAILEERLKVGINVFSYPYGGTNGEAEKILSENGFAAAVVSNQGWACSKKPYELPRVRIGNVPLSSYGF